MSCPICAENYTEKIRKEVKCTDCANSCCMECFKTYNLAGVFKCMHTECNKNYSFNEICSLVNKKAFTNKLCQNVAKKHFATEQKKLTQFKELTVLDNQKKETNEEIKILNEELKKLREEKRQIVANFDKEIKSLTKLKFSKYKKQFDINKKMHTLSNDDYIQPNYKIYCSHANCTGLLSKDYICITCKKETCKKCLKPLGNDHVCSKEDLETVKMITENSVQCPECGMHISKISGCSQMYCLRSSGGCGTIFNYNTGLVDKTGRVHNPHALQERRETLQANDCFDYFEHTDLRTWIAQFKSNGLPSGFIKCFNYSWGNCNRLTWHIRNIKKLMSERKIKKGKNFINHQDEEKWFSQFKIIYKKNQFDQTVVSTLEEVLILLKNYIENYIEEFKSCRLSSLWINGSQAQLNQIFEDIFAKLRESLQHYGYTNTHQYTRTNYVYFLEIK